MTSLHFGILVFLIFNLTLRVGDIQSNRGPHNFTNAIVAVFFTLIIQWMISP